MIAGNAIQPGREPGRMTKAPDAAEGGQKNFLSGFGRFVRILEHTETEVINGLFPLQNQSIECHNIPSLAGLHPMRFLYEVRRMRVSQLVFRKHRIQDLFHQGLDLQFIWPIVLTALDSKEAEKV